MLSNLLWNFSISVKERQVPTKTNPIKTVGKALTSARPHWIKAGRQEPCHQRRQRPASEVRYIPVAVGFNFGTKLISAQRSAEQREISPPAVPMAALQQAENAQKRKRRDSLFTAELSW